jgi:hypothetical protein
VYGPGFNLPCYDRIKNDAQEKLSVKKFSHLKRTVLILKPLKKEKFLIFNRIPGKISANNSVIFVITKIVTLELNVTKNYNNYN